MSQANAAASYPCTDDPNDLCYIPPYPTGAMVGDELAEVHELAQLRDDPEAVASANPGRERQGISLFLEEHPQPTSATRRGSRRAARGKERTPPAPMRRREGSPAVRNTGLVSRAW